MIFEVIYTGMHGPPVRMEPAILSVFTLDCTSVRVLGNYTPIAAQSVSLLCVCLS